MFHADKKIGENLGGVILHHETIYQTDANGKRNCSVFTDHLSHIHIFEYLNNSLWTYERIVDGLTERGILKGIKTDLGWMLMPGTMGEMTTHGLDNLYERSVQYKKDGCVFAKVSRIKWHLMFLEADFKMNFSGDVLWKSNKVV